MARVNIDARFFADKRFELLGRVSGLGFHEARSRILDVWFFSYGETRENLTSVEIELQSGVLGFADKLVEAHLAELNADGSYRIKGAFDRFGYLEKRKEAGRRSAEVRREKFGSAAPVGGYNDPQNSNTIRTETEHMFENPRTETEPPAPAPAPALSPLPPEGEEAESGLTPKRLVDLWNEHRGKLPACKWPLGKARHRAATARLKEGGSEDDWVRVIKSLASWEFGNGKNDRGWVANFDFLTRGKTFERALEGQFTSSKQQRSYVEDLDW